MRTILLYCNFLFVVFSLGCNFNIEKKQNDTETTIHNFFRNIINQDEIIIDTLLVENELFSENKTHQIDSIITEGFTLVYHKKFIDYEFETSYFLLNNKRFNLSDYITQFDRDNVDGIYSLPEEYFTVVVDSNAYFIFDTKFDDCSGSLCRYCNIFIFRLDFKTRTPTNLLVIDYYETNYQHNNLMLGCFKNQFCFYNFEEVDTSNVFTVKPYIISKDSIYQAKDSVGNEYYYKIKFNKSSVGIIEKKWVSE